MAPKGLKAGKFLAKKVGPGAVVLCAAGAGWAWYRSDAHGWVRVGDTVSGESVRFFVCGGLVYK